MTEIETLLEDNQFYLTIKGHAGYAEEGKDIVCSAISILAFSLDRYLCDKEADGEIGRYVRDVNEETAEMCFSCQINPYDDTAKEGIMAILNGFEILSKNYEKNVHFSPKGNIFDKSFT